MALDYEVLLSNGDVIKFENATIEIKGTAVLVIAEGNRSTKFDLYSIGEEKMWCRVSWKSRRRVQSDAVVLLPRD
jgi:hypothetical protein